MGAGIAQVGAQTGHKVTLCDVSQDVLDKSQARISESIKRVAKKKFKDAESEKEKFITEALQRLNIATNPDEALSTADLVVEAGIYYIFHIPKIAQCIFIRNISTLPPKTLKLVISNTLFYLFIYFFGFLIYND